LRVVNAKNNDIRHRTAVRIRLKHPQDLLARVKRAAGATRDFPLRTGTSTTEWIRRLLTAFAVLLLSACASEKIEPILEVPEAIQPLPFVQGAEPEPVQIPIIPAPEIEAGATALPEPPGVAIVLTGRQPAYDEVAFELSERLENFVIYDLSDKSQPAETAFRQINDSDSGAVVAIGLGAAQSSVAMSNVPVVFSQVFNYQDSGLVTGKSRGVAALAPLDAHLAAWKESCKDLRRIGAIIGAGHEALVEEAQIAAQKHDLQLTIKVVNSDQEGQYQFRRMVADIDGFWLFPDNRVLSSRSLREIFAQAKRRRVSVAVSNEALLPLGATISIAAVPADIASTIVDVVRRIEAGQLDSLPELTPLQAVRVMTN
jgi:ABC-type uncharacterized transport system substrate-binding protein